MQRELLTFLQYYFTHAEAYAIFLMWIVCPLGYYACYLFFQRHFGMFLPRVRK